MQCRNRVTDIENTLIDAKGAGVGVWEIWMDINTLLCMRQMTNENLLYRTGNSIQCSAVT